MSRTLSWAMKRKDEVIFVKVWLEQYQTNDTAKPLEMMQCITMSFIHDEMNTPLQMTEQLPRYRLSYWLSS